MKAIRFLVLGLLFSLYTANAQVSVNVNIGTPPVWAPPHPVVTQYYYLPAIDVYYDVPQEQFIYLNNGAWIRSVNLPYRYRNYQLQGSNVVYLTDYRGDAPYRYHKSHKVKYYKDNGYHKGNGKGKGKGKWKNRGNDDRQ